MKRFRIYSNPVPDFIKFDGHLLYIYVYNYDNKNYNKMIFRFKKDSTYVEI